MSRFVPVSNSSASGARENRFDTIRPPGPLDPTVAPREPLAGCVYAHSSVVRLESPTRMHLHPGSCVDEHGQVRDLFTCLLLVYWDTPYLHLQLENNTLLWDVAHSCGTVLWDHGETLLGYVLGHSH